MRRQPEGPVAGSGRGSRLPDRARARADEERVAPERERARRLLPEIEHRAQRLESRERAGMNGEAFGHAAVAGDHEDLVACDRDIDDPAAGPAGELGNAIRARAKRTRRTIRG